MLAIVLVLFIGGILGLAALVLLGATPDSRRPGVLSYPAAPDPEPWHTES